jgi:large conductance mechanosensitive channel
VSGFKNFILRGNLVELAVAFVMAAAFAKVVTATVAVILGLVGKVSGQPDFSRWQPGGLLVGAWITAVVAFVILAAVVYFLIVAPYARARERFFPSPAPGTPEDLELLRQIRDALVAQQGGPAAALPPAPPA